MIRIVLDSTALFERRLTGSDAQQLLRMCSEGRVEVHVSEVVVQERVRQHEREIGKLKSAVKSLATRLQSALALEQTGINVDALCSSLEDSSHNFDEGLRSLLTDSGVVIAPLPAVPLHELLGRDLAEVLPFKDGKGMRDTLLWLSLLENCPPQSSASEIILITENWKDFGVSKESNQLAPSLVNEFAQLNPELSIKLVSSIAEAVILIPEEKDDLSTLVDLYQTDTQVTQEIDLSIAACLVGLEGEEALLLDRPVPYPVFGSVVQTSVPIISLASPAAHNQIFVAIEVQVLAELNNWEPVPPDTEGLGYLFKGDFTPKWTTRTTVVQMNLLLGGNWKMDVKQFDDLEVVSITEMQGYDFDVSAIKPYIIRQTLIRRRRQLIEERANLLPELEDADIDLKEVIRQRIGALDRDIEDTNNQIAGLTSDIDLLGRRSRLVDSPYSPGWPEMMKQIFKNSLYDEGVTGD
jgi:hypothetical protein